MMVLCPVKFGLDRSLHFSENGAMILPSCAQMGWNFCLPYIPAYKSKNFGQFSLSSPGVGLYAGVKI